MDTNVERVLLLVGLAVGVDYSLFYLRRSARNAAAGRATRGARGGRRDLGPGRADLRADRDDRDGGDVLRRRPDLLSFGIATMIVVAVAMLGSLTVLPALIARLGDRVDRGRIPFLHRRAARAARTASGRRSSTPCSAPPGRDRRRRRRGSRSPLAVPAFGMHTAQPGLNALPNEPRRSCRRSIEIQAAFPGGATPALSRSGRAPNSPAVKHAVARLRAEALATGEMTAPVEVDVNADRTVARVDDPARRATAPTRPRSRRCTRSVTR